MFVWREDRQCAVDAVLTCTCPPVSRGGRPVAYAYVAAYGADVAKMRPRGAVNGTAGASRHVAQGRQQGDLGLPVWTCTCLSLSGIARAFSDVISSDLSRSRCLVLVPEGTNKLCSMLNFQQMKNTTSEVSQKQWKGHAWQCLSVRAGPTGLPKFSCSRIYCSGFIKGHRADGLIVTMPTRAGADKARAPTDHSLHVQRHATSVTHASPGTLHTAAPLPARCGEGRHTAGTLDWSICGD